MASSPGQEQVAIYFDEVPAPGIQSSTGDSGSQAASKLNARLGPVLAEVEGEEHLERRLAPLARLLGAEIAGEVEGGEAEDGQSARESFFGAVRAVLEALARERPLLLAWEDIHWADEGTLDLIEYLSQWLRAPILQVGLARDELLERRPSWGTLRRVASASRWRGTAALLSSL